MGLSISEPASSPRKPKDPRERKDDNSQSGALDGSLLKHMLDDVDPFGTFASSMSSLR